MYAQDFTEETEGSSVSEFIIKERNVATAQIEQDTAMLSQLMTETSEMINNQGDHIDQAFDDILSSVSNSTEANQQLEEVGTKASSRRKRNAIIAGTGLFFTAVFAATAAYITTRK